MKRECVMIPPLKRGNPSIESRTQTAMTREYRRLQVAKLFLEQCTVTEIAEHLNVSCSIVSRDLKAIRKGWVEANKERAEEILAMELARLDHVVTEYWAAWERSKQSEDTVCDELEPTAGNTECDQAKVVKRRRTCKAQCGNPVFLQGIERCIERRCKLLGVEPPQRIQAEVGTDWSKMIHAMDAMIGPPGENAEHVPSNATTMAGSVN